MIAVKTFRKYISLSVLSLQKLCAGDVCNLLMTLRFTKALQICKSSLHELKVFWEHVLPTGLL